jgi:hypothetical protein
MNRISRLGRLAAVAVLVASGATVALTSTATAANTQINYDCLAQYTSENVENSDTVTITMTTSSCQWVVFIPQSGASGSATLNSAPMTPGIPVALSNGNVIVYTAPASGSGTDQIGFPPNQQAAPAQQINITFPSPSVQMVDNGDGSMTVTYVGNFSILLYAEGTTCPDPMSFNLPELFSLFPTGPLAISASPALVTVGTPAVSGSGGAGAITAGTYQACSYLGSQFVQALTVGLGVVVPTTTTTTAAASGDLVVPAFTG